jgi:sec-independent protein translocase protein TatA
MAMSLGFWQIALLVILFLLFFGRGKIPQLMGDIAEGIKSFKKGINDSQSDDKAIAVNEKVETLEAAEKKV